MEKTEKNKQITNSLLEKSKALRAKSKETEAKFNQLKAQLDEFIHLDKNKSKQDHQET